MVSDRHSASRLAVNAARYRGRRAAGEIVLPVVVPEVELAERLVLIGFLTAEQADNRAELGLGMAPAPGLAEHRRWRLAGRARLLLQPWPLDRLGRLRCA